MASIEREITISQTARRHKYLLIGQAKRRCVSPPVLRVSLYKERPVRAGFVQVKWRRVECDVVAAGVVTRCVHKRHVVTVLCTQPVRVVQP